MEANNSSDCYDKTEVLSHVYPTAYVALVSSCLSIFGSSLIILSFLLWKDVRRSMARIILLFLALADLGAGLGYLISSVVYIIQYHHLKDRDESFDYEKFCRGISFFTTFFPVSSFFWTAYLAIYFVVALVLKKPRWSYKLLVIFNITAWTIPLVICILAVSFGILGGSASRMTGAWCFVAINGITKYYHYDYSWYLFYEAVCGKAWELLFYFVVVVCYSVIFCVNRRWYRKCISSKKKQRPSHISPSLDSQTDYVRVSLVASNEVLSNAISKIDLKLLLIPVVFVLLRAPGTYRYFLSMSHYCYPSYINQSFERINSSCILSSDCFNRGGSNYILYLQALCDPLQGFGNAILFVFFSRVIMHRFWRLCCYRNYFTRYCRRKTPSSTPSPSPSSIMVTTSPPPDSSSIQGEGWFGKKERDDFAVKYSPSTRRAATERGFNERQLDDDSISSSIAAQITYGTISRSGSFNSINANN